MFLIPQNYTKLIITNEAPDCINGEGATNVCKVGSYSIYQIMFVFFWLKALLPTLTTVKDILVIENCLR